MTSIEPAEDRWIGPGEVADLWKVHPKTVARWSDAGRLPCVRTDGGQRKFLESVVKAQFAAELAAMSGNEPADLS